MLIFLAYYVYRETLGHIDKTTVCTLYMYTFHIYRETNGQIDKQLCAHFQHIIYIYASYIYGATHGLIDKSVYKKQGNTCKPIVKYIICCDQDVSR